MMIVVYFLCGFVMLFVWNIIALRAAAKMSFKDILKTFSHAFVFVLLWPIDIIWCIYRLIKHPEEFENEKYYFIQGEE